MPARAQHGDVRRSAVAGTFYPAHADTLRKMIAGFLSQAQASRHHPKALIVPHAGYRYSGPVAASGYARLTLRRHPIGRVVLLGPSHHVAFQGLAATTASAFATPLGTLPIDGQANEAALKLPQVHPLDAAHQREHSLEVQLPFLQMVLDRFTLVPFSVGQATTEEVAELLELLWDDEETLVVISSDLSHFHDAHTARRIDRETAEMIEQFRWTELSGERACGYVGIRGLLHVAQARGLQVQTVDLRNSGDLDGMRDRVVGYGSFVVG